MARMMLPYPKHLPDPQDQEHLVEEVVLLACSVEGSVDSADLVGHNKWKPKKRSTNPHPTLAHPNEEAAFVDEVAG